jgi:hypothetical protein
VREKWGGTMKFPNGSKVMPKWKFWVVDVNFLYNFIHFLRYIAFSRLKRLSYLLELLFWHILAKFKKNPRNGFFAKSQKLVKMAKNCVFFRTNEQFSRKRAKISKKWPCYVSYIFYPQLHAKFRKKSVTHGQMHKRTDLIL